MMLSNGKVAPMPIKLTDSEIVRIMEICVNKTDVFVIHHNAETREYDKVTLKDILGVINRLKAENERLTAENILLNTDTTEIKSASFYFELEKQRERAEKFAEKRKNEIKAQAYTEYAELLKSKLNHPHIQKQGIDFVNFLKAMVDDITKELGDTK